MSANGSNLISHRRLMVVLSSLQRRNNIRSHHLISTCCYHHERPVILTSSISPRHRHRHRRQRPDSSSIFAARQHYVSSFSSSPSPTSSSNFSSSSSVDDIEEHNRKVAAAQALVFARLQRQQPQDQHQQKQKPQNQRGEVIVEPDSSSSSSSGSGSGSMSAITSSSSTTTTSTPSSTLSLEEKQRQRRVVLKSIQLWLSEDPPFFVATMEKLDLKVLQPPNNNKNSNNNNNGNNSINSINDNKNNINHIHPIQSVWDQYRQLYYESIPDFVTERLSSEKDIDGDVDNFNLILQELISGGFGDPQWSRKFRQVRGYRLNQDKLTRHIAKQRNDLKRLQHDVLNERSKVKFLEDKLINISNTAKFNSLINNNENDNRRTRRRKNRLRQANKIQIDNSHKNTSSSQRVENEKNLEEASSSSSSSSSLVATPMSFFHRVKSSWASLSSSFWVQQGSTSSSSSSSSYAMFDVDTHTSSKTKDIISKVDKEKDSYTDDYDLISQIAQQKSNKENNKIRKRIGRKRFAIKELQEEVDEVSNKIQQIQRSKSKNESPIPIREYELAQKVVTNTRDSICSEFANHLKERHTTLIEQYQTLDSKTDLTKPQEWYSYARLDRRKIIYHGGPTNSGKTYSALQRLKEDWVKKGLYLGPLRLLAAEVYETLTADGLYTNLYTGQERRDIAFSTHAAATVEMCNVNEEYDIVVIDEIQMIADVTRGAAWTKALMGLRCKEIHVCGGLEAKDIVKKIANACGDDFELHHYERFTDLQVSRKSLARNGKKKGAYRNVQPGDCIVAFSRNDIFAIKREIESMTDHKCCVIYGKLPPQTRADQARRFNDPESGYDILVASDAIGMGLNLNIKRIIFNSIFKFNGEKIARLNHSEIKQISGRAGRRNSPYPNGEVSCRDPRDLGYIRRCMSGEIEPIRKAALLPTEAHIELFSEAIHAYDFDGKTQNSYPDLHQILKQFSAMATVKGDFFLGRQTEMQIIAKRLKNIPIRLRDAYIMCLSPTTDNSLQLLESFATKVSQGEVFGLPSRSVPKKAKSFDDLSYLCNIYSDVDLFMWLQYKFPPGNQVELAAALARKEQTMQYINAALSATETLKLNHCYLKQANRHRSSWEMENGGPSSHNSNDDDEFVSGGFVDDQKEQFIFVGDGYNSADDDDDDEEYAYSNFKDKDAVKYL